MKVTLLKPEGYCAGVTNAINIAYEAKRNNIDKEVYILGMLVHNESVIKELSENGITTLYRDKSSEENILYNLKEGSVVIFSAHGHRKELDKIAEEKHFIVYDATCPKVMKNLAIIDEEISQGHDVIYIGHKDHPEALAALSHGNKVYFYDIKNEFNYKQVKDKSPLVINQTTLNTKELKDIYIDIIVNKPKARILDEICAATRLRQEAVINIPSDTNLILIVGDKKSSNTNRLLEIAKTFHSSIPSYLISNVNELKEIEIDHEANIAIASGASTPKKEIDSVVSYLSNL